MSSPALKIEVIRLYRGVLRASRKFTWIDPDKGAPWGMVLRANARKEFEDNRHNDDPIMIRQLVARGWQALDMVEEMVVWRRKGRGSGSSAPRIDHRALC